MITLKPIVKELFEVVIRTAKAPMTIKDDTIEYNASSFKVPPGSTVEDLLRRLPGVLVDPDGTIKAQVATVRSSEIKSSATFFGHFKGRSSRLKLLFLKFWKRAQIGTKMIFSYYPLIFNAIIIETPG